MTASSAAGAPPLAAHRGPITVCVMLATIMQTLDTTIANVALPYMQGSLSATLDQINWVLTSYIVAAAIMTPPTGWLASRFGRKRLFLFTVAGFTAASVLCGLAASLEQMVVFRLLQGVFGAPLVPLSQAVLLDTYPRERHAYAMAIWGIGVMVGPILGPVLGGWITESWNWRWVFWINLPVGILAFLGLSTFLGGARGDAALRFDWFGFTTLSVAIGALQMVLDRGERLDWFDSTEIALEAGVCALAAWLFVVHTFTAERPFLDPRMFRDRNLVAGLIVMFMMGIILLGTLALLSPFLQQLLGYPALSAGMVLAPRGVGTMAAMMIVGRLGGRVDQRWLIGIGFVLIAIALWEMAGFTIDVSQEALLRTGIVQGFGMGLVFPPLSTITFSTLPPVYRTQGAALFSLMRNIGASIGISLMIFLLGRGAQVMHADLVVHANPFNPMMAHAAFAGHWNLATEAGRVAFNDEISRQALVIAFANDFRLMTFATLIALPLVFLFRRPRAAPRLPSSAPAD